MFLAPTILFELVKAKLSWIMINERLSTNENDNLKLFEKTWDPWIKYIMGEWETYDRILVVPSWIRQVTLPFCNFFLLLFFFLSFGYFSLMVLYCPKEHIGDDCSEDYSPHHVGLPLHLVRPFELCTCVNFSGRGVCIAVYVVVLRPLHTRATLKLLV